MYLNSPKEKNSVQILLEDQVDYIAKGNMDLELGP
jgi:hypothetical protein